MTSVGFLCQVSRTFLMVGAVLDNSNLNEAQGWAASAVARQRNYFESGATRSYAFRLRQLKKLQEFYPNILFPNLLITSSLPSDIIIS